MKCMIKYEKAGGGDRFVWDKDELEAENDRRAAKDDIRVVYRKDHRDNGYDWGGYGLRAHKTMNARKCFWSILVPWHRDFLAILITMALLLYFVCLLFFIVIDQTKHKNDGHPVKYHLHYHEDFEMLWIATFGIAFSVGTTLVYLILYPISETVEKFLGTLEYIGLLVYAFFFTFAFVGSELARSTTYFPFLFVLLCILAANLVLLQYEIGKLISIWTTVVILLVVYVYDFIFFTSAKQREVFYIPMFVELAIVFIGWLLFFFSVPERFFPRTKWIQMYFTGYIIFLLFFINFAVESQRILEKTIKLNSGYYVEKDDNWWHVDNVYNHDYDQKRNETLDHDKMSGGDGLSQTNSTYGERPANQTIE